MTDVPQGTAGTGGGSTAQGSPESTPSLIRPSTPRVLIAPRTVTDRRTIRSILRSLKVELVDAKNGEDALAVARSADPDLILLDVEMPDGRAACAQLKADPRTAETPIVFLSRPLKKVEREKGVALGAADYLTKPFQREEMLARVNSLLEIRMLSRSLRDVNDELVRTQHELDENRKAAAHFQNSFVPRRDATFPELAAAWRFVPCGEMGGDAFNLFRLDQDHIGLYVLDVSGRGVPAAMMTVAVSQTLTAQVGGALKKRLDGPPHYRLAPPVEVLTELDRSFPIERYDRFCSINYLLLDAKTGSLRCGGAGQPHPLLLRASGELEVVESSGTFVGLGRPYREVVTRLAPGDRIFLYTIGVPGVVNRWSERFGNDRVVQTVQSLADRGLEGICDGMVEGVRQFAGAIPPAGDVTFVAVEYRGR